ncbi:MAG: YigZ family protein [Atopobiaceae bacterium]|nr:YigZ family protein [Atopobiaceae bacterium]
MMESYQTLKAGTSAIGEFTDRKSRFIAEIRPCTSETEAHEFLSEVKSHYFDARHQVPAWIFADGRKRCSDDGEPSRTAGMPTLEVLEGAGLKDVCCVTTRYFGGTLLGPGGLVRAYTAAAQAAVEAARTAGSIIEMTLVTPVVAEIPYSAYERVRRMAEDTGGKVTDSIFSADVQLTLAFRSGEEEPFLAALKELAAGEERAHALKTRFAEF